ncbi:MAG: polymer-forming cytoskeletal protein [Sandaracinaceae bacterium]
MASTKDLTGRGEIQALLGKGTEFEGVLAFEGRVRVEGAFKGKVFSEGILILGDGAEVEAEVEVGTLIVRGGTLRGNVRASQLVEIHAEGAVHGDIEAPQFDIDKGCVFEGKVQMTRPDSASPDSASPPSDASSTAGNAQPEQRAAPDEMSSDDGGLAEDDPADSEPAPRGDESTQPTAPSAD